MPSHYGDLKGQEFVAKTTEKVLLKVLLYHNKRSNDLAFIQAHDVVVTSNFMMMDGSKQVLTGGARSGLCAKN